MKADKKPSALISVLNMGLGHATRTLPVIRYFLQKGWNIFLAGSGRSLLFLQQELPGLSCLELPDYELEYSPKGVSAIRLFFKIPAVLRKISAEYKAVNKWLSLNSVQLLISDHRYGCYSPDIPSFFLAHQLAFIAPPLLKPFESAGRWFNRQFHLHYNGVLIPDEESDGSGLLSGRLSRHSGKGKYTYCGILSSVRKEKCSAEIDFFFSVSGPEPQRWVLEQLIRSQISILPGKKVVALGKPESGEIENPDSDTTIYHHLSRTEMQHIMNCSKFIITRPGYSTIMELAELKKKALFIPTPGQTEQIYLAKRFKEKGWFNWKAQKDLLLSRDIPESRKFPGFPYELETRKSVVNIFDFVTKYTDY